MKVLILSCNTGQGHNSAAHAICETMHKFGHDCVVKDALAYVSKTFSNGISRSYTSIVLHTPGAFGICYRRCKNKKFKKGRPKSISYGINMIYSKRLYRNIVSEKFDAVIATHVFAAQALTHIKHRKNLSIPLYVVATDFAFCPYYDELDMTKYFISLKCIEQDYIDRKIPAEKIVPSGIPVSKRFNTDVSKQDARKILGIESDKFLCVIMSGSMGFGNITEFVKKSLSLSNENYHILVITGNNKKLKKQINENFSKYNNISTIGFTDKVHLYMKACDLVVTKPGGLTTCETMVSNVPLILISPIPGVETDNYDILTDIGVAFGGRKIEDAVSAFERLMNDPEFGAKMIEKQKAYINKNASECICLHVLKGLGAETNELCNTQL